MISLILPAYNEVARIETTVREALDYFNAGGDKYEIIVAADGTDGTREAALAMSGAHPMIKVIGSPARRGKGIGIREAVAIASGTIIGFSDADNKTPISEYAKFAPLLAAGADVVIGSRALRESRIERPQPLYRRLGSRGFALFMRTFVGLYGISDSQCGFKFFQADVARDLFRRQQIDDYMFDVEILYLAQQLSYRVEQVAVRWRDDGDSRFNVLSGSIKDARDVLSVRWRHRRTAPRADYARDAVSRSDG
jgi:dolichyl-phosphate beta-glucosyltransferase